MNKNKVAILSIIVLSIIVFISMGLAQTFAFLEKKPAYHEYANVVINNGSEKNNIAPVVFNHWLHRAEYTCRVCHMDLNFAMKAGDTGITENDNKKGLYCGACHNGKEAFAPEEKGPKPEKNCVRCHSYGKKVEFKRNFYRYTKNFPRGRFGNGIDWLKAEKQGLVKLKDTLEGIVPRRRNQENPGEIILKPTEQKMPDILFSHEKHAIWNGCELCHPSIFSEKKDSAKFTMEEIFAGKHCGTCHGKVSFSTLDCQRCHVKMML